MERRGLRFGFVCLSALLALSLCAPAQARWGEGRVDTWLARRHVHVGEGLRPKDTPVLALHVRVGATKSIYWVIENLGGQPSTHYVSFTGCAGGNGVRIAYSTADGNGVTYRVTHDGYRSALMLREGDRTALRIRVTGRAGAGVWRCRLGAAGLSGNDAVVLKVTTRA
ncbi:MAG: hypothetical protein ACXVWF_03270 [Actinomycetota bacterium]